MKKCNAFCGYDCHRWKKLILAMKLTVLIFFLGLMSLSASSYSQATRLSLAMKNVSIIEVFEQIESQSEFVFIYKNEAIDLNKRYDVEVNESDIEFILNEIFKGTGTKFEINDRQVIITKNRTVVEPKSVKIIEVAEVEQPQNKEVSGAVTDTKGLPLPGVSVVVKGTTIGTVTDVNGKFQLSIPVDAEILQFSFVGMKTQEVAVGSQTSISVVMEEEAIGIEEVVAVGYGTMKKSDLTGSIASVKSDEISAFPTSNAIHALAGRAAGVQIQQSSGAPDATIQVRIRGTNSIKGSNEPLYVIDGFPGDMSILNNTDIESVEILKDASATAIYGSRGANGVVLITTKQGKTGRTKVEYESNLGMQSIRKKLDLLNATEYAEFYNEYLKNTGTSVYFTQSEIDNFEEGTDWQDVIFRNALIQNHSLNISGGTDKTKFFLSGTIFDQEGIMKDTDYKRYTVKADINHELSKRFIVDFGVILNRTLNDTNYDNSSLIFYGLSQAPTLTPYNNDGSILNTNGYYSFITAGLYNPLYIIKETNVSNKINRVQSNVSFSYKITPELIIRVAGNIGNYDSRGDSYITNKFVGNMTPGSASVETSQSLSLLSENTITYIKNFSENHKLNALAGFTYEEGKLTSLAASGSGFVSDVFETYNLGAASTFGTPSTSYTESTLLSYLGRINYSYKDRYMLTVSMRTDGSSKYSEGQKWGYFPSGALAWRVSDENFMNDVDFISDLKLRIGWGKTGSQAISAYATQVTLSSGKTVFDDSYASYFAPGTTYPGDLKWETTEQTDIGFDIGLLDNHIHLTADYYYKKTRDLLNSVTLPSSMGWASTIKNVGSIENKGLELALDVKILNTRFKWDISGNIAFNRNKVIKLYDGKDITGSTIAASSFISDYINLLREGHPFAEFYGYMEDGYDESGFIKYKDIEPDGVINTSDKTFIGDPNPDFIYGLNSTMSFQNFELSMFFQGSQGNDVFNLSCVYNTLCYYQGANMLQEVYADHWTPANTDAKYPVLRYGSGRVSDRFVEDGSYLRLKNIMLAYNLPVKKFGIEWLSNLQIYLSGQNLFTITSYSWWDPEVNTYGSSTSLTQGVDKYSYPSAKTVTCGIKVKF